MLKKTLLAIALLALADTTAAQVRCTSDGLGGQRVTTPDGGSTIYRSDGLGGLRGSDGTTIRSDGLGGTTIRRPDGGTTRCMPDGLGGQRCN
jgi:hypothetical protein